MYMIRSDGKSYQIPFPKFTDLFNCGFYDRPGVSVK